MKQLLTAILLLTFAALSASSEQRLTASEAATTLEKKPSSAEAVARARYAEWTRGQPTFLNLEKPYPEQIFTIMIWSENRAKFERAGGEVRGQARLRIRCDTRVPGRAGNGGVGGKTNSGTNTIDAAVCNVLAEVHTHSLNVRCENNASIRGRFAHFVSEYEAARSATNAQD